MLSGDRLTAHEADHRRIRRVQAHAFSEKALSAQEPILQDYIRQFIAGLKRETQSSKNAVSLSKWYNFTTFDVIGDLAFGEPFGCSKTGVMHPWIQTIFNLFEVGSWITEATFYNFLGKLVYLRFPKDLRETVAKHRKLGAEKARRRMNTDTDRPDFMTYIMKNNNTEKGMTDIEIQANADILIAAGSETVNLSPGHFGLYLTD